MASTEAWWRSAVVYQLYLRSFADGDGDGIGDFRGVLERIHHLGRLGVDGVWFSPFYPSPQADQGYDVADYCDVDPVYGTLEEVDDVMAALHRAGLTVLIDIVPNHCSIRHPWFVEALGSEPGSRARDRFHFRPGRGADGAEPPNNWESSFGGPAWTRVEDGEWYLHMYGPGQPDLNWANPEVVEEFDRILSFWLDRGVDGFRIDVAEAMAKDPELPDWHPAPGERTNRAIVGRDEVYGILRRWRGLVDGRTDGRDRTLIGEVWGERPEQLDRYLEEGTLPQAFYFNLMVQPWSAEAFRSSIEAGLSVGARTGAPLTWTLGNHDVRRVVTRYGRLDVDASAGRGVPELIGEAQSDGPVDLERGRRRARAAALLSLALPGACYLYQGDELGLPEVLDLADHERRDPTFARSGGTRLGRDGCRVPLPWTATGDTFGFSSARSTSASPLSAPWLPQPDWFADLSVETQEHDEGSMLLLYREALRLRPSIDGELRWLRPPREDVLAFSRGGHACVVVFGDEPLPLSLLEEVSGWAPGRVILRSDATDATDATDALAGQSAAWVAHG